MPKALALSLLFTSCAETALSSTEEPASTGSQHISQPFATAELWKAFGQAHTFARSHEGEDVSNQLDLKQHPDLKQSHFDDFHRAFKTLSEPGHKLEEYNKSYLHAHMLSGYIGKQLATGNPESQKIAVHYLSIAQHLKLIKRHVTKPLDLLLENLFGMPRKKGSFYCLLRGKYYEDLQNAVTQDPLHRKKQTLKPYFDQWFAQIQDDENTPAFQLWLLQQENATQVPLRDAAAFPPALGAHEAVISKDGKIDAPNGRYIYVFKHGKLYMLDQCFHHDDVLGSTTVECGGKITIEDGKITVIANNSGHYKPTPFHLLKVIGTLQDMGVFAPCAKLKFRMIDQQRERLYYPLVFNVNTESHLEQAYAEIKNKHYFSEYQWQPGDTNESVKPALLFTASGTIIPYVRPKKE